MLIHQLSIYSLFLAANWWVNFDHIRENVSYFQLTVVSNVSKCVCVLYYSDYTDYFVIQASVVWARKGERKERSYEAFTQVQLCDPTHVHGGHQAARGEHRCAPQTKRRTSVTVMGQSSDFYVFYTISWTCCRCSTYVVAWSPRYEK